MKHTIHLIEQKIAISEIVRADRDGWQRHVGIQRAKRRLIASGFGAAHADRTIAHVLTLI